MNVLSRSIRIIGMFAFITSMVWATEGAAAKNAYLWSKRAGDTIGDHARAVAVDATGNVYITGQMRGTLDFGGGPQVGAGYTDVFLVKYNSSGLYQWSQVFGNTSFDLGYGLATDGFANIYLVGAFTSFIGFGGVIISSSGDTDAFIAKFNSAGVVQWAKKLGGVDTEYALGVAVDNSGNAVMTGFFGPGSVTEPGLPTITSTGESDIFLIKYDANGVALWLKGYGGVAFDGAEEVALDSASNIIITGVFNDTMSNMGGASLSHLGNGDIFLAKFNAAAVHQWSQRFGGANFDHGYDVATDIAGDVFLGGYFSDNVSFGGSVLASAGATDAVLAQYNSAGVHQWSKRFGGTLTDMTYSVAADASGNCVISGFFNNSASFGGSTLTSAGSSDVFVAKFAPFGLPTWSARYGGVGTDYAWGVALGPTGSAHLAGGFSGLASFGGAVLSGGLEDIFLAKYGAKIAEPVISSIKDIGNDQGRKVKIVFTGSGQDDAESSVPVIRYEAYRRTIAAPSALVARDPAALSPRGLLIPEWTEVGTVNAHGESEYSMDAPTIGDSTIALGQYRSTFFIRGATAEPTPFFDSLTDSGYSLDNLAPGAPSNFAYSVGQLSWNESTDADFDYFTVYGSNLDAFGSANVVDYTVATDMDVNASPYVFYFVTATDFSGNESKPAKINTLSGTGGAPRSYVLSVSNFPNPFNPSTTVSYTVPSRGKVTVAIYDARGARVTRLVDNEERDAGAYRMDWNGHADSGIGVSSGVYFARIEQNGAVRTKKLVLLK